MEVAVFHVSVLGEVTATSVMSHQGYAIAMMEWEAMTVPLVLMATSTSPPMAAQVC